MRRSKHTQLSFCDSSEHMVERDPVQSGYCESLRNSNLKTSVSIHRLIKQKYPLRIRVFFSYEFVIKRHHFLLQTQMQYLPEVRYIYMRAKLNTILNLTPHAVKVLAEDGEVALEIPKPDQNTVLPRVATVSEKVGEFQGAPLLRSELGAVENLPEMADGQLILVSAMVRLARPDRKDLVSPGSLVRNDEGQPVGCQGLTVN